MDLASILLNGLVSSLFGLGIGGMVLLLSKGKLTDAIISEAEAYAAEKLTEMRENPEIVKNLLKPALLSMVKD